MALGGEKKRSLGGQFFVVSSSTGKKSTNTKQHALIGDSPNKTFIISKIG